jgi:hypothetical protein
MIAKWIGPVFGFLGLLFAVYQYRQRARMESVVRDTLQRLAGEMRVVFSNANWTNQHLRNAGHLFIEGNLDLTKIKHEVFDAARDAASCARQLALEHSKIRGIQRSLFKDSVEIIPEIPSDDVKAAVLMRDAHQKADEKKPEAKTEAIALKAPSTSA